MLSCAGTVKAEFGQRYLVDLKGRDPDTEAHFAAYFSGFLEIKLRRRLRSRDMAEDIRQETLARVLEAIYTKDELKHPERFGAFVNSVCNNVLHEHWRSKRTMGEPLELTEQVDSRRTPEDAAQFAQEMAQLREVLLKVQKRDRDVLRMVYWDERDRREISRLTHLSVDHLRVVLHRAKHSVREYLRSSEIRRVPKLSRGV